MKKAVSLILALTLCMALSIPALAAEKKVQTEIGLGSDSLSFTLSDVLSEEDTKIGATGGTDAKMYHVRAGTTLTAEFIHYDTARSVGVYLNLLEFQNKGWISAYDAEGNATQLNFYTGDTPVITLDQAGVWYLSFIYDTTSLYTMETYLISVEGDAATAEAPAPAQPETPVIASAPIAYARTQAVELDGKNITLPAYALKDANGNATNYVKLRDLASVLNGTAAQFNVGWDGAVNIESKTAYTPNGSEMTTPFSGDRAYKDNTAVTNIDGAAASLQGIVLTDDNGGGYTYFKLRDVGQALGFNVGWSSERGIFVETDKPYSDAD